MIYYDLPWEGVVGEQARNLMKEIYAIGIDEDTLLLQTDEMEYEFDVFDIDKYIVLAQIMLKLDLNLKKSRHELVPEMITEDDFWRNYFYKIEVLKRNMGLPHKLGARVSREARASRLKEAIESSADEEAKISASTATLKQAKVAAKQGSEIELKSLADESVASAAD